VGWGGGQRTLYCFDCPLEEPSTFLCDQWGQWAMCLAALTLSGQPLQTIWLYWLRGPRLTPSTGA
jgi:hypothetical protein